MKKLSVLTMLSVSVLLGACSTLATDGNPNFGSYELGRSIPERISDESIEFTIRKNLSQVAGVNENAVRIAVDSFHREVLLTGEVPSQAIKAEVEALVSSMKDVMKVYNYLAVDATPRSQSHTLQENYLKAKINARLLPNKAIKSSQYKIVVRDRTAYVMGNMTQQQQQEILAVIQQTSGMASAVTLTNLVDEAQLTTPIPALEPVVASPASADMPAVATDATATDEPYALQEIFMPNATNTAPSNSAPVYSPTGTTNSSYVQLYQGTNNP